MDQTNVLTLLALSRRMRVVVTEHSDPGMRRLHPVLRVLRRLLYPSRAHIVSVSRGVDRGLNWAPATVRTVIHNPVDVGSRPGQAPVGFTPGRYVVALGRLRDVKGFDLLLRAFARVVREAPEWRLAIVGEGPERERLERDIQDLGLERSVALLGAMPDPFPVLRAAGMFAMSSRWEGFGNVLVEAMACGLPVVSFACPSGPDEIIAHEADGLLVPPEDVDGLVRALLRLANNPELRTALAASALEKSRRFSLDVIVGQWEREVFDVMIGPLSSGKKEVTG